MKQAEDCAGERNDERWYQVCVTLAYKAFDCICSIFELIQNTKYYCDFDEESEDPRFVYQSLQTVKNQMQTFFFVLFSFDIPEPSLLSSETT